MPVPIMPIIMGISALGGILQGIQQGNANQRAEKLNRESLDFQKEQFDFSKQQTGIQNLFTERGLQNQTRGINMDSLDMLGVKRDIMRNKSVNKAMYNSLFPSSKQQTPDFNQYRG